MQPSPSIAVSGLMMMGRTSASTSAGSEEVIQFKCNIVENKLLTEKLPIF